jgi:hypothetical protein
MPCRIAALFAAIAWMSVVQAGVPQSEVDGLVGLFNATNGAYWRNAMGWLTDKPVCSWSGVLCSADQDHVV